MKNCEVCQKAALDNHNLCVDCEIVASQIPYERILTLWADRDMTASIRTGRTCDEGHESILREEWKIVGKLWDRFPNGSSCWMSAFYAMLRRAERYKAAENYTGNIAASSQYENANP